MAKPEKHIYNLKNFRKFAENSDEIVLFLVGIILVFVLFSKKYDAL